MRPLERQLSLPFNHPFTPKLIQNLQCGGGWNGLQRLLQRGLLLGDLCRHIPCGSE